MIQLLITEARDAPPLRHSLNITIFIFIASCEYGYANNARGTNLYGYTSLILLRGCNDGLH
jgi:hypothetical protein